LAKKQNTKERNFDLMTFFLQILNKNMRNSKKKWKWKLLLVSLWSSMEFKNIFCSFSSYW